MDWLDIILALLVALTAFLNYLTRKAIKSQNGTIVEAIQDAMGDEVRRQDDRIQKRVERLAPTIPGQEIEAMPTVNQRPRVGQSVNRLRR